MPTWLLAVVIVLPFALGAAYLIVSAVREALDGDRTGIYVLSGFVVVAAWMVAFVHLLDRIAPL